MARNERRIFAASRASLLVLAKVFSRFARGKFSRMKWNRCIAQTGFAKTLRRVLSGAKSSEIFASRIRFITREKSTRQVHAFTYVSIIALLSLYKTNRLPLQNPSSNAANATSNGPLKKPKRTPSRRKPKRRKGKRCSNAPKSTSRSTSPKRKI